MRKGARDKGDRWWTMWTHPIAARGGTRGHSDAVHVSAELPRRQPNHRSHTEDCFCQHRLSTQALRVKLETQSCAIVPQDKAGRGQGERKRDARPPQRHSGSPHLTTRFPLIRTRQVFTDTSSFLFTGGGEGAMSRRQAGIPLEEPNPFLSHTEATPFPPNPLESQPRFGSASTHRVRKHAQLNLQPDRRG